MSLSIGFDPGEKSGYAIALDGVSYFDYLPMRDCSYRNLHRWFYKHRKADVCVIEHIHARPGNVTYQAGLVASMERARQAAAGTLSVEPILLRPQAWQKPKGLVLGNKMRWSKDRYKKWKKQQHANKLMELMSFWYVEDGSPWYPDIEIADSILLAYIGLEILEGTNTAIEHF